LKRSDESRRERRGPVSLGDVIRAARSLEPRDTETRDAIREMLGVEGLEADPAQPAIGPWMPSASEQPGDSPLAPLPLVPPPASITLSPESAAAPEAGVVVRRVKQGTSLPAAPEWLRAPGPSLAAANAGAPAFHVPALFGPPRGRAILSTTLSTTVPEGAIDVDRILLLVSRGKPVAALPRKPSLTLRRGVQLLLDHGSGMDPFRQDRDRLVQSLDDILSDDRLEILDFIGCPSRGAGTGTRDEWKAWTAPAQGTPVVAVTDVGIGGAPLDEDRANTAEWLEFAHHVRAQGCVLIALVPYEARRWPPALTRGMTMIHWCERTTVGSVRRAVRDAYARQQ
jgi:hypothetical protein